MNLIINIITNPRPLIQLMELVGSVVTVAAYIIIKIKAVKA